MPPLQQFSNFLKVLSDFFYPNLEISVFEKGKQISNWGSLSNHKEDNLIFSQIDYNKANIKTLKNGKTVKEIYYKYSDLAIRLRSDVSLFKSLQDQITQIFNMPEASFQHTWNQQMGKVINEYLLGHHLNIASLTKKEKIALTKLIFEKGLLDFKDATSYLAKTLNVSRATIYNYLNWTKSIQSIEMHQVNAFTAYGKGGNPAGVILNAENLDLATMKNIARDLNLSETAFVIKKEMKEDSYGVYLRYFTRSGVEVGFCGHSTVGVLYMLMKYAAPSHLQKMKFIIHTQLGLLNAAITDKNAICFSNPSIFFSKIDFRKEELLDALGLNQEDINDPLGIEYETRNKDLFLTVNSLKILENIRPEQQKLLKFCKHHSIVAVCVIAMQTIAPESDFHIRCFCPLVGVDEDPVTGSIANGLVHYLMKNTQISKSHIVIEQGHFMEKPGLMTLEIVNDEKDINVITHATAKHFSSSEIYLS